MGVHRDRSRIHEARVAGLAITLSIAALIFVVAYVVGGFASRTVIVIVDAASPTVSAP